MENTGDKKIYYLDDEFDFESIMREFGSGEDRVNIDYEAASQPVTFDDIDDILSASLDSSDDVPPEPKRTVKDDFAFDADAIVREYNNDGFSVPSAFDPDEVRREFASYAEKPVKAEPEVEAKPVPIVPAQDEPQVEIEYSLDDVISEVNDSEEYDVPEDIEPEVEDEDVKIAEEAHEPDDEELLEEIIGDFADGSEFEGTKIFKKVKEDDLASEGIDDINGAEFDYADGDVEYEAPKQEHIVRRSVGARKPKSFRERIVTPFVSAAAFIALKIQQSKITLSDSLSSEEDLGEEMPPDKAAKFYASHVGGLRLRTRLAFVLSLVLLYISYGLPVIGAMNDVSVKSGVCLVLLLAVMIVGLDIITSGIMSLIERRPHANSLIALSALFCVIDAFIITGGMKTQGLPFCVIPALTISFSLLGSVMNCHSSRIVFNNVSSTRKPYTVTAETSVSGDGVTVLKSRIGTKGFVRRTEEAGPDETVYGVMAPFLIVIVLLLSIIAAAVSKSFAAFAHILSGIFVCAAPLAMLLTFPLPNFVSATALRKRGAAIAGWSGLYDLGKCRNMIITDSDLFTKENVKISKVRIFAGLKPEKVVSLAGSIISASGSILVPAFTDLMVKGKGTLLRVENFECHEGGGLIAMVDGVEVYCGSASFMHLMGVHLPEEYKFRDCIYISEGTTICGMFEMSYTPTDSVKDALYTLMQSDRNPVFAVRDFNITPKLLSVKYDMPTDGFDFPSFAERYEISGAEPSADSKPAALLSREGLGPFVELAEHAKNLYTRIRICVLLAVLSTVIGIGLMFVLSMTGGLSVATALTFLLVWLIPIIIISFTMQV